MSKTTAQPLNIGDKLTITYTDDTTEVIEPKEISGVYTPVHINSNYTCQAAVDTIRVEAEDEYTNLKIKVSSLNAPVVANSNLGLSLHNYVNGEAKYTKFDFENLPTTYEAGNPAFTLNISIPNSDSYGLIAFYYISEGAATEATLEAVGDGGISRFNCGEDPTKAKTLQPELNIIKVEPNVTQLKVYPDSNQKGSIIFSDLDIIKGINPKLDYRRTTVTAGDTDRFDQLLEDIKNLNTPDFYYNVPISGAQDIDLNPLIASDTLSSPLAWYDPNNVNRKFVISEIDADYLSTGITLTKASRA
jgi:hypothetical protein